MIKKEKIPFFLKYILYFSVFSWIAIRTLLFFVNTEKIGASLSEEIGHTLGLQINYFSSPDFNFLLSPSFTYKNVIFSDEKNPHFHLEIDQFIVTSSLFSLLQKKPIFSSIKMVRPFLQYTVIPNDSLHSLIPMLEKTTCIIEDGTVRMHQYNEITRINGSLSFHGANTSIASTLQGMYLDNPFTLDMLLERKDTTYDLSFKSTSPALSIETHGIIDYTAQQGLSFKGEIKANTEYFPYALELILNGQPTAFQSHFSPLKAQISLSMEVNQESFIIDTCEIESMALKGKGKFALYKNMAPSLLKENAFHIEYVDIDALSEMVLSPSSPSSSKDDNISSTQISQWIHFSLPSTLPASFSLTAKEGKFLGKKWKDFNVKGLIRDETAIVEKASVIIENEGKFTSEGVFSHNGFRPRYAGKLQAHVTNSNTIIALLSLPEKYLTLQQPQSLTLASDIEILPGFFEFSAINATLDTSVIKGDARFKTIGNIPKFDGNLSITHVNFDNYIDASVILPKIPQWFKASLEETKDYEALENFNWLRMINKEGNLSLKIDDATFNHLPLLSLETNCSLSPTLLECSQCSLRSPALNFDSNFVLNIADLVPSLTLHIVGDHFNNMSFTSPTKKEPSSQKDAYWSKESLSLETMGHLKGDMDVAFKDFTFDSFTIENFSSRFSFDEGLHINLLQGECFNGSFQLQGTLRTLGIPSFSSIFTVSNIELNRLLSSFLGYNALSGRTNASGSLITFGNNPLEWVSSLKGKINFVTTNIDIAGFDLTSLTQKTSSQMDLYQKDALEKDIFENSETHTKLDMMKGQVAVDNGLATCEKVEMTGIGIASLINGTFNFPTLTMYIISQFSFYTQEGKLLSLPISLKGLLHKNEKKILWPEPAAATTQPIKK